VLFFFCGMFSSVAGYVDVALPIGPVGSLSLSSSTFNFPPSGPPDLQFSHGSVRGLDES